MVSANHRQVVWGNGGQEARRTRRTLLPDSGFTVGLIAPECPFYIRIDTSHIRGFFLFSLHLHVNQGRSVEWYTPPGIIALVVEVMTLTPRLAPSRRANLPRSP
jgi:hypothetical protein